MTSLGTFVRISLFFRFSIFIASIVFPISSLITEQLLDVEDDQIRTAFVRPCFIIYLALLAITGVFSSIAYRKSTTGRQLVGSLILCLVVGYILLNNSLSDFSSAANQLEKKLTILQPLYCWDHTVPLSEKAKDATDIWDRLQTEMKCCGVHSPEDWSRFAPKKYPTTVPISCYDLGEPIESSIRPSGTGYDNHQPVSNMTVKIYEEGCAVMLEQVHFVSLALLIAVICFSLFLDLLSIIITVFTKAGKEMENSRKVAVENCAYPTELGGLNSVKPAVFQRSE